MAVECGGAYADAGATAFDGCMGILTSGIVTLNPVDTAVSGTYTVTYNVDDGSGNSAVEVTRTVTVGLCGVAVPNVVGLAQAEAEAAVLATGLAIGTVTTACSNTVATGLVISQNPPAPGPALPGSAVDLVVSTGPCAGGLAVTSPNGGEVWAQRDTRSITWSETGVTGQVAAFLNNNGVDTQWLGQANASDLAMAWTVPASLAPGSGYRIHLISADDNSIEDLSDATFTIAPAAVAPLTVTSPNGGEEWIQGGTHAITWTSNGLSGGVAVYLNDSVWVGAADVSAGTISYTVPGALTPGAYRAHVIYIADN